MDDRGRFRKSITGMVPWIYKHPRIYETVDLVDSVGLSRKARKILVERLEGRVLEVGIGSAISKKGLETLSLFGVDTSISMLRHAKRRSAQVCLADSRHLPFKDKQFDTVLFIFSLRVMSDQKRALEEALRVGKDLKILDFCPLPSPLEWIGRKIYSQGPLQESCLRGIRFRSTPLLRIFSLLDLDEQRGDVDSTSEQSSG